MPDEDVAEPEATVDPAVPELAPLDVRGLVERVERTLIGGQREFTRLDLAVEAELSVDEGRALWRALGFGIVDDGERMFTQADVDALELVKGLRSVAELDDESLLSMTRVIGQSFARLAAWQGQMVLDIVAAAPELQRDPDRILGLVDEIVPITEKLHNYVWRRQLAAYFARVTADTSGSWGDAERDGAVGFVDMAGFTALTRRSDQHELRGILERFETLASDAVSRFDGQVVKTIGDEVLFLADTAADAARIALFMVDAGDEQLPPLRAGVAAGPVVRRLGDVFGGTVNIASRLTSLARKGTVLADRTMAEVLAEDERFSLKPMRAESVRGYHRLHPWRLRSAAS